MGLVLLGLVTILGIIGIVAFYAQIVMGFSGRHDYQAALKVQAQKAEGRAKINGGMNLNDWLSIAAHHLMKLWPEITYDWAMRELREYLSDAIDAWPSSEWDWSTLAAKEAAENYMHDFGEQYGANQ